MDDNTKIQVLMLYYKHWGNEQNKIRKTIHGLKQLRIKIFGYTHAYIGSASINLYIQGEYDRAMELEDFIPMLRTPSLFHMCIQMCFDTHTHTLYDDFTSLTNDLLAECGGYNFLTYKINNDYVIEKKKQKLCSSCQIFTEEALEILYDDEFSLDNILYIDAVLSLL